MNLMRGIMGRKVKVPITLSLDEDLVESIDGRRGLVPRSRYVEALIEKSLGKSK